MFGSVFSRDPTPSTKREDILSMHSIQQVVNKTQSKREKQFSEAKVRKREEEK